MYAYVLMLMSVMMLSPTSLSLQYSMHPALKFTVETETDGAIAFLDMKVIHKNNSLSSTWYTKSTDTGLLMNYHALAPMKYKKSVIIGMIHRIFRACSTYKHFHESLQKARDILLKNQYPCLLYTSPSPRDRG